MLLPWLETEWMTWLKYLAVVLVVAVTALFYYAKKTFRYFEERGVRNLPCVPVFGNFFDSMFLRKHFIDVLDEIYSAFPEDKYVGAFEFYNPIILIRDPEIIKKITVKDFEYFVDHRSFFKEDHDNLFGDSLLFLKGQKWRDMRATLSPAFTGSKMRQMIPFMGEISKQIVVYLHQEVKKNGGHQSEGVDMFDLFTRYANDVIASCAFGYKVNSFEDRNNDFYRVGLFSSQLSGIQRIKFFLITIFPRITRMFKMQLFPKSIKEFLYNLVFGTMKHREENHIVRPDMIHLLMEAKKGTLRNEVQTSDDKLGFATVDESDINQSSTVKRKWTDKELASQAFIFFFAGFESSASTITLAVHELAINPHVQEKLREEIDNCHAINPELTYEVLQSLKYMDMVISESLRKWSPAIAMDRECLKEYTLEPPRPGAVPVTVKPKDYVYCLVNSLHMDEKYFPNPHKFDPERFSDERKHEIQPFTYMPFGVGPRNCIASRFALMEVKVLLYHLLLEFELVPCSKTINPIQLQPMDFNIRVAGGSWLKIKARK